ncbi:hypothetical protein CHS0354_032016 [Potamilus streckersoni]|uniref:SEA domain-containing protein n=1 Tax=Potamilus streckersoni TaxID=2493646 RepID=A0AAE0TMU9_9BIVA|nr:hypothetical protein CHS0354_032016 [Potamilus streckersoni]
MGCASLATKDASEDDLVNEDQRMNEDNQSTYFENYDNEKLKVSDSSNELVEILDTGPPVRSRRSVPEKCPQIGITGIVRVIEGLDWHDDLHDPNTTVYKELEEMFTLYLHEVFAPKIAGFIGVQIHSFR